MQIQVFSEEMVPRECAECQGEPVGQMVCLVGGESRIWLHRRPCANRAAHLLVALTESHSHTPGYPAGSAGLGVIGEEVEGDLEEEEE